MGSYVADRIQGIVTDSLYSQKLQQSTEAPQIFLPNCFVVIFQKAPSTHPDGDLLSVKDDSAAMNGG